MANLADSLQCKQFVEKLTKCESNYRNLTDWESKFISSLRESFDMREQMMDLGMTPWNPSSSQLNTLSEIAGSLGHG